MTRIASVLGCATTPVPEGRSDLLRPHLSWPRPFRAICEDGSLAHQPMRSAWEDSGADSCSAPLLPLSCLPGATSEVSRRSAANLPRLANQLLQPYMVTEVGSAGEAKRCIAMLLLDPQGTAFLVSAADQHVCCWDKPIGRPGATCLEGSERGPALAARSGLPRRETTQYAECSMPPLLVDGAGCTTKPAATGQHIQCIQ